MQDTVNYLPELAEVGGTRSESKLKTPPGLSPLAEIADVPESEEGAGDGIPSPPVRGTHNCEGKFFAVIGQTLYRLSNSGVLIPIGDVPGIGRVVMDHNQISQGNELTVVNGSAGYVYNTVTDTFARITDPGYPGAYVTRFIGGYMVGIEPRGRFAYSSAPANATSFNTLDRFTSEVSPDRLVGMEVTNNELLLLSETTGEFFQVTSNSQQPIRTKGITIDKGCAGAYTVVRADNTIFWLGSDGCFYSLRQYAPVRISKRPLEQAIRGLNWSQAFAFVWEDAGHTVVYWTFPDGRTWGYDAANGEWHRRESYGLNRWRVNSMTRWNNRWIAGDYQRGRLWELDWDYVLEGDQEFISERTLPAVHDNQNLVLIPRLELLMDTGQEETAARTFPQQPERPTISGSAPDGLLGVPYAGYTYSATGGSPPYTFISRPGTTLTNAGLSMDSSGEIGTEAPTQTGSFVNIVRVTDANGMWDELTDTVVVGQMMFASYVVNAPPSDSVMIGSSGGSWDEADYVNTGAGGTNGAELIDSYEGRIFSVGNGYARTSSNRGQSWSGITGAPSFTPASMVWSGDEWLFFYYDSGADLYHSTDAVAMASRGIGLNHFWRGSVRRGDTIILCAGVDGIAYSTDKGLTFSEATVAGSPNVFTVVDAGTEFVAFDWEINGVAYASTLGDTWAVESMPANSGIVGAAVGDTYVGCVDAIGQAYRRLRTGGDWAVAGAIGDPVNGGAQFYDNQMVFANDLFFVGGESGRIWTSPDLVTWTERFDGTSGLVKSLTPWRPAE